jgi:hypothetical protein
MNTNESLYKIYSLNDIDKFNLYHDDFSKIFKNYLCIGGMPECVSS